MIPGGINHEAWYGGGILGMIGGAYWLSLEMMVGLMETMATTLVIVLAISIWRRNSQTVLKWAILPGFISHVFYAGYAIFFEPSIELNDICQILNTTAYPALLYYCWWNRRECYAQRQAITQAESSAKETTPETQEKGEEESVLGEIPYSEQVRQ